jgi:NAD(P)-dependent dehydrogenase (short-subunit alcohol dehydrogenase family)
MNESSANNDSSANHRALAYCLDGRIALVTGGASGIGEATVKELARAGAFVWIADINLPAAEALAAALDHTKALRLDVTDPESIAQAVKQVGQLDILVNNAGVGHVGSIEATEPEDFDRLLNVNVRAVSPRISAPSGRVASVTLIDHTMAPLLTPNFAASVSMRKMRMKKK